jgi:hypothetical protein
MAALLLVTVAICTATRPATAYLTQATPTLADALAEVAARPAPANETDGAAHDAWQEVAELRALLARVQRARQPLRQQPGLGQQRGVGAGAGTGDTAIGVAGALAVPCGDCYGAGNGDGDCCQTCEDVLERYRRKGWGVDPSTVAQCQGEGGNDGQAAAAGAAAAQCAAHLACHTCVSGGCGWCISQRACRPDVAWQCQVNVGFCARTRFSKPNALVCMPHTNCILCHAKDAADFFLIKYH